MLDVLSDALSEFSINSFYDKYFNLLPIGHDCCGSFSMAYKLEEIKFEVLCWFILVINPDSIVRAYQALIG
jgi:hypothetical protein